MVESFEESMRELKLIFRDSTPSDVVCLSKISSLLTAVFLSIRQEINAMGLGKTSFQLQSDEEALSPYPSPHTCFVCNILTFVSLLTEGVNSRFFIRGTIPAVYLSCSMNYEIDILNDSPTIISYEPAIVEHQELCHDESLKYSEVQFSLDPHFQSDWFSYFVHYFEMEDIFNIWKGNKFISSSPQYPQHLPKGLSLTSNVSFRKSSLTTFKTDLCRSYSDNQVGTVVIFRQVNPNFELFGMWFSWFLINGNLFVVDIQNSKISSNLEEAVSSLNWRDGSEDEDDEGRVSTAHHEIFYAVFKKQLCLNDLPPAPIEEMEIIDTTIPSPVLTPPLVVNDVIPSSSSSSSPTTTAISSPIPHHHRKFIHQILHRTALVRTFPSPSSSSKPAIKKSYRIVELEYYYSSPSHSDPYVHLDPHQSHWMCWYFHRQNGKSYKGGTYKGLDISIGDIGSPLERDGDESRGSSAGGAAGGVKKNASRGAGGLLIRSIQNIDTGEIIQGPCKVVNELLTSPFSSSEVMEVHELVQDLQNSSLSNTLPISISSQDLLTFQRIKSNGQIILCSPRVGLTFRRVSPVRGRDYLMAPYRYTYSNIDYKANKSLLTILESNINKLQRNQLNKKINLGGGGKSSKSAQEWLRSYQEGVRDRKEDSNRDGESSNDQQSVFFQRRMSKYCNVEWKVLELCYLYGYLDKASSIKDMIDYDVERDISEEKE